ncbi:serine hydrolase domain-containing protein [Segetibacter aerophilus]|uniref:Serine hydrolase n=1 Tax=Segetibacter aerophilus TaxID=670293 RepID=A0A512BBA5_9BACT|nr:serine hydrolase domain-containing protein [Segetibacter aerophilus]GEO09254.1 serine hydrolase [Segetibacter aerophilus]
MKKVFISVYAVLSVLLAVAQAKNDALNSWSAKINKGYSKASALQDIMKRYTTAGLPGVSVAIYSEQEGWWAGAAGYSKVETKMPMNNMHLQYLQSISKTYMAVAILKLHEEGRINLDAPVSTYLPSKYSRYLKRLDTITIRMLLNHTSGMPEYSDNPAFVSYVLLHPTIVFDMEKALKFVQTEKLQFTPGSKHKYCNTNYLVLSMIADAITGDHAAYISKVIFQKIGLTKTYYRSSAGYLNYPNLVDSYWDVLNTGKPANITPLQRANVATLKGDDGIVCTTKDAVKFLKGLVEGKLLKDSSLAPMKEWVNDDAGKPIYGLGLVRYEAGGLMGYGHSGGGIGGGCILLYVPEKKIYIFMATNVGTLFGGNLAQKADDMKNEILASLLF